MLDCPKFDRCSAPICPLDSDWRRRAHLKGERVCFYLVEASKRSGRLPHVSPLSVELRQAIEQAYSAIAKRYGPIRQRLRETCATPSRMGRRPPQRGSLPSKKRAEIPKPALDAVAHPEPPSVAAGVGDE